LIAAFLTAFYSARLLYFVFLTNTNAFRKIILIAHEPGLAITFSLFFLALNSIFFGYIFKDMFVGEATNFLNNAVYINKFNTFYDIPFNVPLIIKLLPLIFSFTGIITALILNVFWSQLLTKLKFLKMSRLLFLFLNKRWFFDTIYNYYIATPLLKSGYTISYKLFDKGLIEFFGPYGATVVINYLGKKLSVVQNGLLSNGFKLFVFGLFLSINIILLICF
jgi:NADH-ubiquinone oxidoreductase chain 5